MSNLALRAIPKRLAPNLHESVYRWINPSWYKSDVGGMWDEIGKLQFDFLLDQGLAPTDRLLDIGCGSLRGGVHFVRYLETSHYFGIDINERHLQGGRAELQRLGLGDKQATLLCDGCFQFSRFAQQFDLALAQSVFSHLPFNAIMRCLTNVEAVLVPGGRLYATFFPNNGPRLRVDEIRIPRPDGASWPWSVHCDADPFYYDPDIFRWAVEGSSLTCTLLGDWGHPRGQHMLLFTKAGPVAGPKPRGAPGSPRTDVR